MIGKSSFAIWPTVNPAVDCDNTSCPLRARNIENPRLEQVGDLHVNIWRLPSIDSRDIDRFMDIGLMIYSPQDVSSINIFIPRNGHDPFNKDEFIDLSPKLKNVNVLSAVFNEDLIISNSVAAYQHPVSQQLSEDSTLFTLHELSNEDYSFNEEYEGVLIKIKIPSNIENKAYVRVRLGESAILPFISTEPLPNAIAQKLLSKIETTDFQFNEVRTLDKRLRDRMNREGYFSFKKINSFYISDSAYDILVHSPLYKSCRVLETEIWKSYADRAYLNNSQKDGVLAYHWRIRPNTDEPLKSFSIMTKAKFECRSYSRIFFWFVVAAVITIALNLISSYIFSRHLGHELLSPNESQVELDASNGDMNNRPNNKNANIHRE